MATISQNTYTHVTELRREAHRVRSLYEDKWEKNINFYMGDQWSTVAPKGREQHVLNRTRNVVITNAAIQTEQRPRIRLEPVETNEPPIYFLSDSGKNKIEQITAQFPTVRAVIESVTSPGQLLGDEAIDPTIVNQMMGVAAPSVDPSIPPQPLFAAADFVAVNDSLATEALQQIHDIMWERVGADYYWVENVLMKSIVGHQPMLIEWDEQKKRYSLSNIHPKHIFIAPESRGVEDADYVIYDQVLPKNTALRMYPDFKEQIIDRAIEGEKSLNGEFEYGKPYLDITDREIVTLTTFWSRDDFVDNKQVPVRQVRMIDEIVLEDIECPFADIPIVWNINLPVPYRPYGESDIYTLKDLQQTINKVSSIFHNVFKYYQAPQLVMSESTAKVMKGSSNNLHSHSGRAVVVPDYLYQQYGGKPYLFVDPPSLPTSWVQYFDMLLRVFDDVAERADVLQGRVQGDADSSKAIQALQSAARGPLGFRSLYTERAIRYATKIIIKAIMDFLPEEDFARMVSKHPTAVIKAMRDRLKTLDIDVKVEVISGKGTNRAIEEENARLDYSAGLETRAGVLERLGRPDAKQKAAEIEMEEMRRAGMMAPQGGGMAGGAVEAEQMPGPVQNA